jgi:DNA-binding MarR family transcriptional regulator
LPSGSAKKTKRPHGNSCTSLASTPRSSSSALAASTSSTTRCRPATLPGSIWFAPAVSAIEQAEPGGVNRTDLHCLNAIENAAGLTAGELAAEVGLTSGAVTGVIDRLERANCARRVPDPTDRRRVKIEVTPEFYAQAEQIWGAVAAEWKKTLATRFTAAELTRITEFLYLTNEVGKRHLERLQDATRP